MFHLRLSLSISFKKSDKLFRSQFLQCCIGRSNLICKIIRQLKRMSENKNNGRINNPSLHYLECKYIY